MSRWPLRVIAVGVIHAGDHISHWACGLCCEEGADLNDAQHVDLVRPVTCIQCLSALVREIAAEVPVRTDMLDMGACCDCGCALFDGPQGGGSMTYYCSSVLCGSRFCYSLSWERTSPPHPLSHGRRV